MSKLFFQKKYGLEIPYLPTIWTYVQNFLFFQYRIFWITNQSPKNGLTFLGTVYSKPKPSSRQRQFSNKIGTILTVKNIKGPYLENIPYKIQYSPFGINQKCRISLCFFLHFIARLPMSYASITIIRPASKIEAAPQIEPVSHTEANKHMEATTHIETS